MNKDDDILIRIGGKTHRLQDDDPQSLQKIPWPQRKRLISLLEAMKKADYVEPGPTGDSQTQIETLKPETRVRANAEKPMPQDSDAMMQRFLAEQQSHKSSIPSKAAVYKWFLIIFAIIFILVLIL